MRLNWCIEGDIRVRPTEFEDAHFLQQCDNDPEISASNTLLEPLTLLQAQALVNVGSNQLTENSFAIYIVLLKENDKEIPIGYIQLYNYDSYHKRVALGIVLLKEFRRMGYGRQLLQVVENLSRELQLHQIYAEVVASNKYAINFFESSSFSHVSSLPQWFWENGIYQDLLIYQLCLQ